MVLRHCRCASLGEESNLKYLLAKALRLLVSALASICAQSLNCDTPVALHSVCLQRRGCLRRRIFPDFVTEKQSIL